MDIELRQKPLNRDIIKYIAMFTMLLNHIANVFLPVTSIGYERLTDIGYFTAIMCYFPAEGYGYTRSKRNYGLRPLFFRRWHCCGLSFSESTAFSGGVRAEPFPQGGIIVRYYKTRCFFERHCRDFVVFFGNRAIEYGFLSGNVI